MFFILFHITCHTSLIDLLPITLGVFSHSSSESTFTMSFNSTITYTKVSPLAEEVIPKFAVAEKNNHGYIIDSTNIYFKCDNVVRVFNRATGELRLTLEGHEAIITTLSITDNSLISIDKNVVAKRWNTETGECVSTLTLNWESTDYANRPVFRRDNYIKVAYATDDKIIGACSDYTIRLWTQDETPKCTIFAYESNVVALHVHNNRVFASCRNGNVSIRVWNFSTEKHITEMFHNESAHNAYFTTITSSDDTIFAGDYHGNVLAWCSKTLKPTRIINRAVKYRNLYGMSIWAIHYQDNILTTGTYVNITDVAPFMSWNIKDSRKQAFVALLCMQRADYPSEIIHEIMSYFYITTFDRVNTYSPDGKFAKSL